MTLGDPIKLRLNVGRQIQYEAEAAGRGMALGPYLRWRLEQGDDLLEQIGELRRMLTEGFGHDPRPATGLEPGLLIEILLLLRAMAGEGRLKMVHAELERQGLPLWTGKGDRRT